MSDQPVSDQPGIQVRPSEQDSATGRAGFVAFIGRPNVGKSTLLNRMIGTKIAIVSDKPQTTRNRILGILTRDDAQVVFVDTPGVHRPAHRMNERMMAVTRDALDGVDVVAVLTDVTQSFGSGDSFLVEMLRQVSAPKFLLLNKIDRIQKRALLPLMDAWSKRLEWSEIHPISAKTGDGLEPLLDRLVAQLPVGPRLFPDDQASDVTDRFLAAEIVREKVLHLTRQEVPYATSVLIDTYEEPEDDRYPLRIEATIVVEGVGQKAILIGRAGQSIKRIGIEARRELESLLERRVNLALMVKQRSRWRDDDMVLDKLGMPR